MLLALGPHGVGATCMGGAWPLSLCHLLVSLWPFLCGLYPMQTADGEINNCVSHLRHPDFQSLYNSENQGSWAPCAGHSCYGSRWAFSLPTGCPRPQSPPRDRYTGQGLGTCSALGQGNHPRFIVPAPVLGHILCSTRLAPTNQTVRLEGVLGWRWGLL